MIARTQKALRHLTFFLHLFVMIWSVDSCNCAEQDQVNSILCMQKDQDTRPIIVTNEHQIIVGVSRCWVKMCGFEADEVFGRTPRILQGSATDRNVAQNFTSELRKKAVAHAILINYKKDNTAFRHELRGWQYGDLLIVETINEKELRIDKPRDAQQTLPED